MSITSTAPIIDHRYSVDTLLEVSMSKRSNRSRKSLLIDPVALARAKRLLRADSDAEAVRAALERIVEMDRFARFIRKSRGTLVQSSLALP